MSTQYTYFLSVFINLKEFFDKTSGIEEIISIKYSDNLIKKLSHILLVYKYNNVFINIKLWESSVKVMLSSKNSIKESEIRQIIEGLLNITL